MPRLPVPGADEGAWGDILNEFLLRGHNADGTHNLGDLRGADGREVELRKSATAVQWRYKNTSAWSDLVALTEITGPQGPAGQQGQPGTDLPDATATTSGKLQLAGDLGGTASGPLVKRTVKAIVAPAGTLADYTTDGTADQVEINAAIAAVAAAGGGTVVLRTGLYTISASVIVRSNITLCGEGYGTIIAAANSLNADVIVNADTTNGNANMHIADLKIDGNKTHQSTDSSGIYVAGGATHCDNIVFSQLWVTNTSSMGIHPVRADDVRFTKCQFTSVGTTTLHHGIYGIDNDRMVIEGCIATLGTGNGFNAKQGTHITVTGCIAAANAGSGIRIADHDYPALTGNVCEGNTSNGIMFQVETLSGVNKGTIVGNTCRNNRAIGIYVSNSADCVITGNASNENKNAGVEVHNSRRVVVSGNECAGNSNGANNQYSGILVSGDSAAVNITGNTCIKTTIQQKYGLELIDTCDAIQFVGNFFDSNQTAAASIATSGVDITYAMNKGY